MDEHEDIGAMHAEKFLQEWEVDDADIEKVKASIIATHYPQHPLTEFEKILTKDIYYLGKVLAIK